MSDEPKLSNAEFVACLRDAGEAYGLLCDQVSEAFSDTCLDAADRIEKLEARVKEYRGILTEIIYASDGCVGHRICNHSMDGWKKARAVVESEEL